jgi:hypothetical protein
VLHKSRHRIAFENAETTRPSPQRRKFDVVRRRKACAASRGQWQVHGTFVNSNVGNWRRN